MCFVRSPESQAVDLTGGDTSAAAVKKPKKERKKVDSEARKAERARKRAEKKAQKNEEKLRMREEKRKQKQLLIEQGTPPHNCLLCFVLCA